MRSLTVICLLVSHFLYSQSLIIIKDNIACLYGLKSPKGEWVVNPSYTLIQYTDLGYFIVRSGSLEGILDSSGKLVVPVIYESVSCLSEPWAISPPNYYGEVKNPYADVPDWKNKARNKARKEDIFLVRKNNLFGLYMSNGTLMFPADYHSIIKDEKNFILHRKKEWGQAYYEYRDAAGKVLISERKGYLAPFGKREIALVGDHSFKRDAVMGQCGAINRKGDTIVPFEYEIMGWCCSGIYVSKGQKDGILDMNGNVITPPEYRITWDSGYDAMPCLCRETDAEIAWKDGKCGVISKANKIYIPFIYDEIRKLEYHRNNENYWLLRKGNQYGVAGKYGAANIETGYDTIYNIPSLSDGGNYGPDALKHLHHVIKKKGKFGLITQFNEIISPVENDTFFRYKWDNGSSKVVMVNGNKLTAFDLDQLPGKKVTAIRELACHGETLLVYSMADEGIRLFIKQKGKKGPIVKMMDYYDQVVSVKNFFIFGHMLFRSDGSIWGKGFRGLEVQGNKYLRIVTLSGKQGLLDLNRGKLLFDTVYDAVSLSDNTHVWVQMKDMAPGCRYRSANKWRDNKCGWAIADTTGKILSDFCFGSPFIQQRETEPVLANSGLGLFNHVRFRFICDPVFLDMSMLNPSLYWVETFTGKLGVLDTSGRLVADTAWTRIDPLISFRSLHKQWQNRPKEEHDQKWILESRFSNAILTSTGSLITDQGTIDSIRRIGLCPSLTFDSVSNFALPSFSGLTGNYEMKDLNDVIDHCMTWFYGLHHLYREKSSPPPSSWRLYQEGKNYRRAYSDSGLAGYDLSVAGDKGYSIRITQQYRSGDGFSSYTMYSWINYVRRGSVFYRITLDSVIMNNCEEVLQNELMESIKNRDDLDISCINVSKLYALSRGRFSLSEEGLVMHLKESEHNNRYISLVIPWKRLSVHAGENSIVQLFIN